MENAGRAHRPSTERAKIEVSLEVRSLRENVVLGVSENPEKENMKREKVPRQNPGKMPTYGFR